MNKRLFVILLLILIATVLDATDSNQALLVLKAYKYRITGEGQTNLYIIDSITDDPNSYEENLGYLGVNGRNLDITPQIDSMLGDINSASTGVPVFAYRVESNEIGSFEIRISFKRPFMHIVDGDIDTSSPSIGFKANMYNITIDPVNAGNLPDINPPINTVVSSSSNASGELSYAWTSNSSDIWAVRGSVSMLINEADFSKENTAYGLYSLPVTVTLTKN